MAQLKLSSYHVERVVSQKSFDERQDSIKYLVGVAMRDNHEFRYHKNRDELISFVRKIAVTSVSAESITRAQRKLWEQGLYHPVFLEDQQGFRDWLKCQKLSEEQYRVYYGRKFPSTPI